MWKMTPKSAYQNDSFSSKNMMGNDLLFSTFYQKRHLGKPFQSVDNLYGYTTSVSCSFNGKEKDYESGFHYYGARYYWSELLTSWLSVDPMADKYPSISPYAYCTWNPIKLVDPNGMDTGYYNVQGDPLFTRNGGDNVNMMVVTDKFRMSYDKYLEGNYHSFDVKTISINKMDGMYDYSDESGNECYYSVKGDGQHRNMQKGDNKTIHEASFDYSDQYNVHTHCRDIMDSDGSIKDVGGTNPSYNKDQAGIGDKFGIILGYKKVNTTINFGTSIKSSSAPNNVKLVRAVGFYGKNGPLCNSVDYKKFRETIIKLQK